MQDTQTKTRLFGIKRILDNMPPARARDAKELLPNAIGVGMPRILKIIYATEDNRTTISTNQAVAFADFFGVDIQDIITPYEDGEA